MASIPPFRHYTRRTPTSAADQNRLRGQVENLARSSAAAGSGLYFASRAGANVAVVDVPRVVWIMIDAPGVTSARFEDFHEVLPNDDGTFTDLADGLTGSATFPAFLHQGQPPPVGAIVLAQPSADEGALLFDFPAGPTTPVVHGPGSTVNYIGPSTFVNFDSTTVVTIAGSVTLTGPVCWDHYPLWDAFEDALHASPVANYAGSVKPWWRLNFDASDPEWEISGLVAPPETCEGAEHVLTNTAPVPLVLLPDDAGSVVANRFETPDGLPFALATDESVWVRYDRVLSRWRVLYRETKLGVKDSGGTPDYDDIRTLVIDQSTGLLLSRPGAGQAQLKLQIADQTHPGVMTTGDQFFDGVKHFTGGAWALPFTIGTGLFSAYPAANFSFFTDPGSGDYNAGVYLLVGWQPSLGGDTVTLRVGGNSFIVQGSTAFYPNLVVSCSTGTRYGQYSDGTTTNGLTFQSGLYTGGTATASRPVDDSSQILSGVVFSSN